MPERNPVALENDLVDIEIHELLHRVGNRPSYRAIFTVSLSEVHVLAVHRASQGTMGEPAEFIQSE